MGEGRVDARPFSLEAFLRIRLILPPAFLVAVLVAAWWAYAPGLSGPFLFDDFGNLPALGGFGRVDRWSRFLLYVTSGIADPLGRPLAMASFLLNANDWPADPEPFKRTNILLHLLNAALLCGLLLRLGRRLRLDETRAASAALFGAAAWLLHPLFVSTTLYVVQREAMLPATFVLCGLHGYLSGRDRLHRGQRHGAVLVALSIAIGTLLATLSKANGVLLPLFAWITESLLLAPQMPVRDARTRGLHRLGIALWLVLPSMLLIAYLVKIGIGLAGTGRIGLRPWTEVERLLTEARVLVDYLYQLALPRPYSRGLFNDAQNVSTGLLDPLTTLPALLALAAIVVLAIGLRRRVPALSFALGFYLAGHLVESTTVPLELYFEHRNYLPAMPLFWPLGLLLCGDGLLRGLRRVLLVALPVGLAWMTHTAAELWGNPDQQALIWARRNPDSSRAQLFAANRELELGRPDAATARQRGFLDRHPDDMAVAANLVGVGCAQQALPTADAQRFNRALRGSTNPAQFSYNWFESAIGTLQSGRCAGLDAPLIGAWLDAAASNPTLMAIRGRRQDVETLRGVLSLATNDGPAALAHFDRALDVDPKPNIVLTQAARLASAGHLQLALRHLDHRSFENQPPERFEANMGWVHRRLLAKQTFWQDEIAYLRRQVEADLAATQSPKP